MPTATRSLTLEEYLHYDDGEEKQYELVDGELVEMPPEGFQNVQSALFLLSQFLRFVSLRQLSNKAEIVISRDRPTVRAPDLTVLSEELADAMQQINRSTVTLDMPAPLLVVEVVSPGKTNRDRDYIDKRTEYARRGILEYWIVDPQQEQVLVLTLENDAYNETKFEKGDSIRSRLFDHLDLTANQVLNASL